MGNWKDLPHSFDVADYSWFWSRGSKKYKQKDEQHFSSGTGGYYSICAISLKRVCHGDYTGYWKLLLWDQHAGYLSDKPTRQLRSQAVAYLVKMMEALPHLPLEPVQDRVESICIDLGLGTVALEMLIYYGEKEPSEWADAFDHQMYRQFHGTLTQAELKGAIDVLRRCHGVVGKQLENYGERERANLVPTSLWRLRLLVDEMEEDKKRAIEQRIAQRKAELLAAKPPEPLATDKQ